MIRSILSVVIGLAVVIALVMVFTLSFAMLMLGGMDQPPTPAYLAVNLLYGALSALAGGYVTGWIARQKPVQHALALSAVLLVMGLPGLFTQLPGQPAWYPLATLVIGVGFSLLGGYTRGKQTGLS